MRKIMMALIATTAMLGGAAGAAEIHVLAGGAVQEAVTDLVKLFERDSGHKIVATFAPMGTLQEKIAGGARAHLLELTGAA